MAYGGPPDPDMPWLMFLGLLEGAGMIEARQALTAIEGVVLGIAGAFSGKSGGPFASLLKDLEGIAHP